MRSHFRNVCVAQSFTWCVALAATLNLNSQCKSQVVANPNTTPIDLTEFSRPSNGYERTNLMGCVIHEQHAIIGFEGKLIRYSLEDGKAEATVFDLKNIPSLVSSPFYPMDLRLSNNGNWLVLSLLNQDPTTNANSFLFDPKIWKSGSELKPIASWHTKDKAWVPEIFEQAGLIVTPVRIKNRSQLEIRKLEHPNKIKAQVRLGGHFRCSWWDSSQGLIALTRMGGPASQEHLLSFVNIPKAKVIRNTKWNLPLPYGPMHCMPETATLLMNSDHRTNFSDIYLVSFGKATKKLFCLKPLDARRHATSRNGRFLAASHHPMSPHHYVVNLATSKVQAEFDAPNEHCLALSDDGRYFVSSHFEWKEKQHRYRIRLRDFKRPRDEAPEDPKQPAENGNLGEL